MIKLRLDIFFDTPETLQKDLTDTPYPITDCKLKSMLFYDIANIAPFIDKVTDKEYTTIMSGGDSFISPLSVNQLEIEIDKSIII